MRSTIEKRLNSMDILYMKKTINIFLIQKMQKIRMLEKQDFFDKIVSINVHTIGFIGTAR